MVYRDDTSFAYWERGFNSLRLHQKSMPLKDAVANKEYHRGYWKEYYSDPVRKARHLKAVRATDRKRRQRIREWVAQEKIRRGCLKCGYREHPFALDFAHRDRRTKEFDVASALRSGWSLERVQREAAKCDVLCANHHRIETFKEIHGDVVPIGLEQRLVAPKVAGSSPVIPAKVASARGG